MMMEKILRLDNVEIYKGAEYRVVRGYPDYLVSEYGVIIHREKGFVRTMDSPDGYRYAPLTDSSGRKSQVPVHRFVATAWIENTTRKPAVNHIDGIKHNNVVSNLEWATMKQQTGRAHETGLIVHRSGENNPLSGRPVPENQRQMMSLAKIGERHPKFKGHYVTPLGKFNSVNEGSDAHGISRIGFFRKFKKETAKGSQGWEFEGRHTL